MRDPTHSIGGGDGWVSQCETRIEYDELNRVETITNPLDGVTRYTYDAAGNRQTVTDAEDHTTTFTCDRP